MLFSCYNWPSCRNKYHICARLFPQLFQVTVVAFLCSPASNSLKPSHTGLHRHHVICFHHCHHYNKPPQLTIVVLYLQKHCEPTRHAYWQAQCVLYRHKTISPRPYTECPHSGWFFLFLYSMYRRKFFIQCERVFNDF